MTTLTTTTQIGAPVNVAFQKKLLINAKANCPYFVGSQPAEIEAGKSGTFTGKWRRYENLAKKTTPLAELNGAVGFPTGRTADAITIADYTATIAKYGNYLLLNEEVDLINYNSQAAKLTEVLGINAGESLNALQRNELEDNATLVFSNGGADAAVNTILNSGKIRSVVNSLQRNKAKEFMPMSTGETSVGTAPIRKAFWGITHFDVEADIRQLTDFKAVETYAGQTQIAQGEFGTVGGVRWIATSEASIDINAGTTGGTDMREDGAGTGADLYTSLIFGMDAIGSLGLDHNHLKDIYTSGMKLPAVMMINKPKGSAGSADPFDEVSSMAWKSWHAAEILNPLWVRGIRSGATDLDA